MKGKKRAERLAPRLAVTYEKLREMEAELGAPPSVRELALALENSLDFTSRVHGDLRMLAKMGLVNRLAIPTRRFRCIGPPADEIDWEGLLSG